MAGGPAKDLYEFLVESELEQYYNSLHNDLKIQTVSQIKYLEEDDLLDQGMSKPEIRRLMKYFRKYYPQGAFGKIRKIINTTLNKESDSDSRPTSPSVERAKPQPGGSGNHGSSKHIISSDAITLCKVLGKGEFGTVQQGVWTNDEGLKVQVAIKCLSKEKVNQGVAEFLKEASNMHSLDHDHIVRLYGVVLESDSLMLVTELAPLRSLLECLREPALRASFPVITLTDFAYQIADGMSYLENKRLIHRDLAARNVLVFTKDKVKISDFGLSRALGVGKDYYQTNFNVNLKLPIAWCAPESINYLKFTSASDVWAYAVTLWEMFSYGFQPWAALTGEQTLADLSSGELVQLKQKILGAIDEPNCQRLEMPDACPTEYYKIMLKCWEHNPKDRPTFAEILRILPQIKPEQVQAIVDSSHNTRVEFLHHRTQDIITVLDKKPDNPPILGAWRGITENGKTGLFDSKEVQPFIQIKTVNPRLRSIKVSRSDSSRKSMSQKRKLRADMISRPQNDLRHTGHIGYDGAVFGDVSFIGDNYDKLPYKVVTPYKPQDDLMTSSTTSSIDGEGKMFGGQSQLSLTTSVYSASSAGSGDTLTEVSSLDERTTNGKSYQDEDFTDFKIPDLSSSLGLDLDIGTSFMDEVMKKFESSSFSFEENSFAGEMSPDSKPKSKQSPTGNGLPSGTSWNNDEISSNVEEKKSDHNGWKPKLKLEEDQSSNMPQKVVAPSKRNEQEVEQEEEEEETDEEVTDEEETEESESEAEEEYGEPRM